MPVLDEHVVWYGKIVRGYFEGKPYADAFPDVFWTWLHTAKAEHTINVRTLEKIERIYQEMVEAARGFIAKCAIQDELPLKQYTEFNRYYEEFIQAMRRVERDQAVEYSGFDERTGLRSLRMMHDDIDIEMQRLARQGNPFAVALLKINSFRDSWRGDTEISFSIVQKISGQIRECLRAFDDAYYLGDEYFLLSLKHADLIGAESAMGRLNKAIKSIHIPFPDDPMMEIAISAVVFEPSSADNIDDIIENMKNDLVGIDQKSAIIKYNDLSPLQRYVQGIAKSKSSE